MQSDKKRRPPRHPSLLPSQWAGASHPPLGYFLGMDTSGKRLSIALMSPDGRMKSRRRAGINQENHLFTLADELMRPHGLEFKDLKAVCVLRGPGRFTGIRVGLTFASILNRLAGVRAMGVSTLEVLAYQAAVSAGFKKFLRDTKNRDTSPVYIVSVLHAFRDEYYCQIFKPSFLPLPLSLPRLRESRPRWGSGREGVRPVEQPLWLTEEKLCDYLRQFHMKSGGAAKLYCAGQPPEILQSTAAAFCNCGIRPESIISAALAADASKRRNPRHENLSPIYLKPTRYELEARK